MEIQQTDWKKAAKGLLLVAMCYLSIQGARAEGARLKEWADYWLSRHGYERIDRAIAPRSEQEIVEDYARDLRAPRKVQKFAKK